MPSLPRQASEALVFRVGSIPLFKCLVRFGYCGKTAVSV